MSLTDIPARIADHKINRIDELHPWRYATKVAILEGANIRQGGRPDGHAEPHPAWGV
jgi:hypothetical protein